MRKEASEQASRASQPSMPIASPHRAGHYFGLHPEDQPYQSNKIVTPRHQPELHEPLLYEGQEPAHIMLPSTDSAPALKLYREALLPPRSYPYTFKNAPLGASASRSFECKQISDPKNQYTHLAPEKQKTQQTCLDLAQQKTQRPSVSQTVASPPSIVSASRHPGRPFFTISRRALSLTLIGSCMIFLLAVSIITLGHLNANRSGTYGSLLAIPGTVRVDDLFALRGEKWAPRDPVTFTDDDGTSLVGEDGQPLHTQTNDQGFFQVRVLASSDWHVGQHTLYATDQKQKLTLSTSLIVQAAPAGSPSLKLSTISLDLGDAAGGVVSDQNVTLNNLGGGQITWQASSDQPWLTLAPASGLFAGQTQVAVTANRGILASQQYIGHIQFSQQAQPTLILTLTVTMTVTPALARLALSTTALSCSTPQWQDPANQEITIRNDGGQSMSWSATATTSDGAFWLSLFPARGTLAPGTQVVLAVHFDSSALSVGSYSGLLSFSGEASARVRVALSVVTPGNLVVSPSTLSFSTISGQSAPAQSLTLQNSGSLALDWSATVATLDTGNWLTLTPDHGSLAAGEQSTVQVSASAASLTTGAYQGTLTFNSSILTKTVTVSFAVIAPSTPTTSPIVIVTPSASAVMELQPATLQITTVKGQPPATVRVSVANTGQFVLHWRAQVDSQATSYISLSPAQGTLNPGQSTTITLTIDVSHASASEITAALTVADADGLTQVASGNTELDIQVQGS